MRARTLKALLLAGAVGVVGATLFFDRDPRGGEAVARLVRARESDAFKERLRIGMKEDWAWPGLRSMQTAWTWLELLEGIHVASSYEGDFSWVFSKLYTVIQYSDSKEVAFLGTLAPFYFVIGKDHAGATLFLDELVRRAPHSYNVWFWGGFHAVDNLYLRKMAAYFYEQAARAPQAPDYLAVLSQRLKYDQDAFSDEAERRRLLQSNVDPDLLEKIERARPDWFKK
jgi:hypothetical protein